jgi:hypothetical protein
LARWRETENKKTKANKEKFPATDGVERRPEEGFDTKRPDQVLVKD